MPVPRHCRPAIGAAIVIVGAGIAGMVLAWELRKAGYAPLILEARTRAGGRNWSLRGGDEIREAASVQRVAWDAGPHLYFNPGPARLPYHHEGILSYCRELGVALEVMSNDNRGALLQSDAAFDGRPQRNRQVVNDIRGYVAELAAKAIDHDALTEAVTTEDKDRIRALLRSFGALDRGHGLPGLRPRRLSGTAGRWRTARHAQPATRSAQDPGCRLLGSFRPISARAGTRRRPCCSRSAAWAASARRSAGRWAARSAMVPRSAPCAATGMARGSFGVMPGRRANARSRHRWW